jgi:hypothetical protein
VAVIVEKDGSILIAGEPYEGVDVKLDQAEKIYAALGRAIAIAKARNEQ